ncbi:MAG TPA: hypothetical protein V6C95_09555 [Coleofasciculaceae cyanobacterium]
MSEQALILRPIIQPTEIVAQLQSGQLLRVSGHRGNAIIICHRHHAELAGPGAAVGGVLDLDCGRVIPVGTIALVYPQSRRERQQAYLLRQRWTLFTQEAMKSWVPLQRAENLLIMLNKYFKPSVIDQLSDEVLAQLVGVLPTTIGMVRQALKAQVLSTPPDLQQIGV